MQNETSPIFQMRFPQKLWYLLNTNSESILWGGTGRTILLDYKTLDTYLRCGQSIFKTTHISSFIRQLNLYGFRKVTSHLQDPLCNSSNPDMHEYIHDLFQFGRPELLNKIKRKTFNVKKTNNKACMSNVCDTGLQKARKALRLALKKAAQDILSYKPDRFINCKKPKSRENKEEKTIEDWKMHVTNDDETYQNNYYISNSNCVSPKDPIAVNNLNCEDDTVEIEINNENNLPSPKTEERSIEDYFILPHSQEEGNIIIEVFNEQHVELEEIASDLRPARLGDPEKPCRPGQPAVPCRPGQPAAPCCPASFALPSFDYLKRPNHSTDVDYKEDLYEWKCTTTECGNVLESDTYVGTLKEQEETKPIKITSIDSCGSELKELYYEISKTIDLLNN